MCLLLALITLAIDFATGREIRLPLLYILPVAFAAWVDRKSLAYGLSFFLPVSRLVFEILWRAPELLPVESINVGIEVTALSLYVFLVGRKGAQAREMGKTITTQGVEMEHLRAFTRMVGITLQGRGISPGMAEGIALIYLPEHELIPEEQHILVDNVESEIMCFENALARSVSELEEIRKRFDGLSADNEIALIEVHLVMLKSPSFTRNCKERVRDELVSAKWAVMAEVRAIEEKIKGLNQEFMRERSADVRDVGLRILRNLTSGEGETLHRLADLSQGTIIVAEDLLLSDMLQMDLTNVVAIVTENTSPASHVAILARSKHIPALCDIENATSLLSTGVHFAGRCRFGDPHCGADSNSESKLCINQGTIIRCICR